ncbi:hypothetical protein AD998_20620 [bacterium 336/3]|nr:hypothetical protein AD998_20620 [bacterium 336/3]
MLVSTIGFSQTGKTITKFEQTKLQFSIELKKGFVASYVDKKAYAEVIFTNPKSYANGALWSYNKKFHNLQELIVIQEKDTAFVKLSKMKIININGMTAYFFEGTEKDEKKQIVISNRLIIDRDGFDEFYLIYLNAKSKKEMKPLIQIIKSIKKLKT